MARRGNNLARDNTKLIDRSNETRTSRGEEKLERTRELYLGETPKYAVNFY
jgi:hypothetical protein